MKDLQIYVPLSATHPLDRVENIAFKRMDRETEFGVLQIYVTFTIGTRALEPSFKYPAFKRGKTLHVEQEVSLPFGVTV
ncbi:hypothetical protein PAXRUDRAFT_834993 [Paxillus rubicundulus Ve08.2h10]|uniref:Uncharacterized protein n=1 Tax=Paxillus rubicundulus Ve08.2h10 TaxID=930991 RepID=A0A0D0DHC1_9AGAM|nr:hypothetical protein PAXRUDRAFT_834993 [Paxillus rubicundulus Ve08.2h10]